MGKLKIENAKKNVNTIIEKLYKKLDSLKAGDFVVLAGSIPSTLPDDIYETIMKDFQHKEINFVVDATKDLLLNVLKYKPFLIKPKDVFRFIEKNLMDAVICFQDILDNYPCSYSKINFPNKETDNMSVFSISKICVISKKGFDLTPFKKNPLKKLIIFS